MMGNLPHTVDNKKIQVMVGIF